MYYEIFTIPIEKNVSVFSIFNFFSIQDKRKKQNNRKKQVRRLNAKKKVIHVKTYNTRRKGFISVYHLIYSSRNPPTGSLSPHLFQPEPSNRKFDLKYHYSVTNI